MLLLSLPPLLLLWLLLFCVNSGKWLPETRMRAGLPQWKHYRKREGGGPSLLALAEAHGQPGGRCRGLGERSMEGPPWAFRRGAGEGGLGGKRGLCLVHLSVAVALRTEEERVPTCPRRPESPPEQGPNGRKLRAGPPAARPPGGPRKPTLT